MLINEEQHYYYFMPTTLIVTDYKKKTSIKQAWKVIDEICAILLITQSFTHIGFDTLMNDSYTPF